MLLLTSLLHYAGISMDTQAYSESSTTDSITKDAENVAALDAIGIDDATGSAGGVSTTSQFQRIILRFLIRPKQQHLHVRWS